LAATEHGAAGLYAGALEKLGRRLVDGELVAGQVLRTEELELQCDVSRTVIREAVRVLESMGMVASRRRVGVVVAPRSRWNVYDPLIIRWRLDGDDREDQLRSLSQLRSGVEPLAARLAAGKASPEQCGALTGAVMDMAVHGRSGDLRAYLEADIRFHRTILEASGNEMFAALGDAVAEVLAGRTVHGLMPLNPNPVAIRLHADVAQAVQAADPAAAHLAMSDIIVEAVEYMTEHAAQSLHSFGEVVHS
jgi:DNA-binding FadR family transcriptional regulator